MKKLVSVITPVYNSSPYLEKLVQTAFDNKVDIEFIAIDDCSKDDSVEVLKNLSQQYNLKIIENSENKGAGFCRNLGLKEAKGDYIIFFDSDDFFHIGALDDLVRAAIISDADCIIGKYNLCDQDGENIRDMHSGDIRHWKDYNKGYHILKSDDINSILNLINYPWVKLYKKELITNPYCAFSQTPVHNDIKTHWISLMLAEKVCMMPKPVAFHRHDKSLTQTTNISDKRRIALFQALDEVESFFENHMNVFKYIQFALFRKTVIRWAWTLVDEDYEKDFIEATKQHAKSIKLEAIQDHLRELREIGEKYRIVGRIQPKLSFEEGILDFLYALQNNPEAVLR